MHSSDNLSAIKTGNTSSQLEGSGVVISDHHMEPRFEPTASTTEALHECKDRVLKPYLLLTSLLGWRPLISRHDSSETSVKVKLCNHFYTITIIAIMLIGYVLQYASCFRQDGYPPYNSLTGNHNLIVNVSSNNATQINNNDNCVGKQNCSGNFVSLYLIPDILHFFAYISMLYLLRTTENTETILEMVYIETSQLEGRKRAHQKLIRSLMCFLWTCVAWVLLSLVCHTLHIVAFTEICFTWLQTNSELLNNSMIGFTIITLTWNDMICVSIVTSYLVQCQLNTTFINNLIVNVRENTYKGNFIMFAQRVEESREFMEYLNQKHSMGVSLLLATFGCRAFVAFYGLFSQQTIVVSDFKTLSIISITSILWLLLFAIPVIHAILLTNSCKNLRSIGHEVRCRPFGYNAIKQEELDSFLLYTSNIRMGAKMLFIPISSSGVMTVLLLTICVVLFLGQINVFRF